GCSALDRRGRPLLRRVRGRQREKRPHILRLPEQPCSELDLRILRVQPLPPLLLAPLRTRDLDPQIPAHEPPRAVVQLPVHLHPGRHQLRIQLGQHRPRHLEARPQVRPLPPVPQRVRVNRVTVLRTVPLYRTHELHLTRGQRIRRHRHIRPDPTTTVHDPPTIRAIRLAQRRAVRLLRLVRDRERKPVRAVRLLDRPPHRRVPPRRG